MFKAVVFMCVLVLMCVSAGHAQTTSPPTNYTTVKVMNKGWYVARFNHYLDFKGRPFRSEEEGIAGPLHEYMTRIPLSGCGDIKGTNLVAEAVAGKQIFNLPIRNTDMLCYHVWGTTLIPFWSEMPCW